MQYIVALGFVVCLHFCHQKGIIVLMDDKIIIKGAKENNLKNIDLELPRNQLIVFTGLSGSGKTSLAFDTIFAEGQRRYVESLSSYARMFLGQMEKPNVESITGLSPAISIDQKTTSKNPRSTVGTVTEIYDYLRLAYARLGEVHCHQCGKLISKMSIDTIVDKILAYEEGCKIIIEAPLVRGRKGEYIKLLDGLKRSGFARVRVDGSMYSLDEDIPLDKNKKHYISVIVDRLIIKHGDESFTRRLTDSVETALKQGDGLVILDKETDFVSFNTKYTCDECNISIEEVEPRIFSFNSPFGACPQCTGLGVMQKIDPKLVVGDETKSINQGALAIHGWNLNEGGFTEMIFDALAKKYEFSLDTPYCKLSEKVKNILLYGSQDEIEMKYTGNTFSGTYSKKFEGIVNNLQRRYRETSSEYVKADVEKYMSTAPCQSCNGQRLKKEALSVLLGGKNIQELCEMSVERFAEFIDNLETDPNLEKIVTPIFKELKARAKFLIDVGLDYLTLARSSGTLSGGEAQRIRLATQIGSGLMGVLYILDEPSIGLHQKDNEKLLGTLRHLKNLGNTLIVVEHDEDTMRAADFLVDVGPRAGIHGGEIVAAGTPTQVQKVERSITGQYLSGKLFIPVPKKTRKGNGLTIGIKGARHNNLKNISVEFNLGAMTAVTGVSGSGKSSLVNQILYPAFSNAISDSRHRVGSHDSIFGTQHIDKIIDIDQSPIGRTPRSNPATYTGVFTAIRELFVATKDAKERGYTAGRFSFNVKGGRCEHCQGDGIIQIEMHFLPDVFVPCAVCKGSRYNRETLSVKYKGKNIADVLDMTVEEATTFFENITSINSKIKTLNEVGLNYIKLGQQATTLSGGEAQRVKLATELAKRQTGRTLYILDEPTTGLHTHDTAKLIHILHKLVDSGNTVIVIEHNLDVIKSADYIIDIGPLGGERGGQIIAKGTPKQVAEIKESFTGQFLKKVMGGHN